MGCTLFRMVTRWLRIPDVNPVAIALFVWFVSGQRRCAVCRADVVAVGGDDLAQVDEGVLLAREGYLARGALAVLCRCTECR